MSKQQIHKLPVSTPSEPENPPRKRRRQRTKVTKLHKPLWEELLEQNEPVSAAQQRKEAMQGLCHHIRESIYDFFNTCICEIVLLIVSTALIAGFIVLILKLTGNI